MGDPEGEAPNGTRGIHASRPSVAAARYFAVAHAQPPPQRQPALQVQVSPQLQRLASAAAQPHADLAQRQSFWGSCFLSMT